MAPKAHLVAKVHHLVSRVLLDPKLTHYVKILDSAHSVQKPRLVQNRVLGIQSTGWCLKRMIVLKARTWPKAYLVVKSATVALKALLVIKLCQWYQKFIRQWVKFLMVAKLVDGGKLGPLVDICSCQSKSKNVINVLIPNFLSVGDGNLSQ